VNAIFNIRLQATCAVQPKRLAELGVSVGCRFCLRKCRDCLQQALLGLSPLRRNRSFSTQVPTPAGNVQFTMGVCPFREGLLVIAVVIMVVIPIIAIVVSSVAVAYLAMVAVPVTRIILPFTVMGCNPTRSSVNRAGPISVVPLVVVAYRVPVARDKRVAGARTSWLHPLDPQRRRRADSHSDGKLRKDSPRGKQCQRKQFTFHN
jgi:hypothetical protein